VTKNVCDRHGGVALCGPKHGQAVETVMSQTFDGSNPGKSESEKKKNIVRHADDQMKPCSLLVILSFTKD
jgi:hypothetical protein